MIANHELTALDVVSSGSAPHTDSRTPEEIARQLTWVSARSFCLPTTPLTEVETPGKATFERPPFSGFSTTRTKSECGFVFASDAQLLAA